MRRRTSLLASALTLLPVLASCGEDEQLFNVFEPPPPVTEVPCANAMTTSPWIEEPAPIDTGLGDVWGTGARNIWAVGAGGTVINWDGDAWLNRTPAIGVDLLALHGTAADDMWTVGRGGIAAHYDGVAWIEVPTGTTEVIVDVWAVARNDVWFVGAGGARHWDGTEIRQDPRWPKKNMNAVWASGPKDVRIVGDKETYRYDGTTFATQEIQNGGTLAAVFGTDADNVWTIGHNSMMRPGFAELEGEDWLFSAAPPRAVYFSLWTIAPEELWAGAADTTIFYRTGGQWCREYLEGIGAVNAFWGPSRNDIWAVGAKRDAAGASRPVLLRRRAP